MKRATYLIAGIALVASVTSGFADECADRFSKILTTFGDRHPSQGRLVTETKGQPKITNEFYFQAWDHYLFKSVEPADLPWVLTYDGTSWQSMDLGKTWRKAYSFDKDQTRQQSIAIIAAQAASIRNATCGTEELDGDTLDVLEAEMSNPPPNSFDIKTKYWVREDEFVPQATSLLKSPSFESFVTQTWSEPEEMALPIPQ